MSAGDDGGFITCAQKGFAEIFVSIAPNLALLFKTVHCFLNQTATVRSFMGILNDATITGSFAVVALMAGVANDNVMAKHGGGIVELIRNNRAAVHVLVAQIDDIMGVRVPKASGAGYVFIVGPTGYRGVCHRLPQPELPTMPILKECMMQSIGISIVIIAVHISMAKILGKKLGYVIDDSQLFLSNNIFASWLSYVIYKPHTQELYAIGLTSFMGSFFSIYPVSTALGRTMVNVKSGARTQLSALFSCALLLAIILWFGPLLRDLPSCVLASIITVALKSMFMKYSELKSIYPVSKIDFSIWVVSFTCTVFINVMEGLAISLIFALFTVIGRSQWPEWQYFFPSTDIIGANDSGGSIGPFDMCVFRFDGPLLFTNVER
uniref:Sulfate_transp domain-containing protein n=1 Tax=Angiostrongylus cantonensis TaxID=6313 RepID=A0A0K0CVC7_ANGCA